MNDQRHKADAGKSDPTLLECGMPHALAAVNAVLDYGVAKYQQPHGWKQVDASRYEPAGRRHRRARDMGEQRDGESGLPHLAHEITNLLFILQKEIEANPEVDYTTFLQPPTEHLKG